MTELAVDDIPKKQPKSNARSLNIDMTKGMKIRYYMRIRGIVDLSLRIRCKTPEDALDGLLEPRRRNAENQAICLGRSGVCYYRRMGSSDSCW
jgi:hypothetical protein